MKKRICTVMVTLLAAASIALASDGICVKLQDGTLNGFVFADQPKIDYDAEDNLVLTTKSTSVTFPLAEIKDIVINGNVETAINKVKADGKDKYIRATDNGAELYGYSVGTEVGIYDLGGKSLQQLQVNTDGKLTVNLSSRPKGTYIIKAEKSTIRVSI